MANQWPPPSVPEPQPTPQPTGWGQPNDAPPAYQPQQPGYPPMTPGRPVTKTKKGGYYAAAAIIILGTVISIVMIVIGAASATRSGFPATVPSSGNVSITKTGAYAV